MKKNHILRENSTKSLILSRIKFAYGLKKDTELAGFLGVSPNTITTWKCRNSIDFELIFAKCENLSIDWMVDGIGQMFRNNQNQNIPNQTHTHSNSLQNSQQIAENQRKDTKDISNTQKKLIPLYNDVSSIGGTNEQIANTEGVIHPSQLIDAGDWFIEATSAIHHYGDSMIEYPSGCILALRDIHDIQKIVWGKNYVVETSEYRITKKLQRGTNENCIKACSTNNRMIIFYSILQSNHGHTYASQKSSLSDLI